MKQIIQKGDLGEAVKDLAAARDISISALERAVGYSPGMISRWIAAGSEDYNSLSKLVAMADLLEVSLDELVGRRRDSLPRGGADGSVSHLETETRTGQLSWSAWQIEGALAPRGLMPAHKSGRLCCGGWSARRDGLKFVLALFCDDIDDEDEPMEFGLYCTPGHNLPLFPVLDASFEALSALYAQILLADAFAANGEDTAHTIRDLRMNRNKTVPFQVLSG